MKKNAICADRTLVFLHIHKASGSSLLSILRQIYRRDHYEIYVRDGSRGVEQIEKRRKALNELIQVSQVKVPKVVSGHMGFGIHEYLQNEFKYFVFLRNPVQRVVSHFYEILKQDRYFKQELSSAPFETLSEMQVEHFEYLASTCKPYGWSNNLMTRMIAGKEFSSWLTGSSDDVACDESTLKIAKENLRHCSIGITERFDESLIVMSRLFGWRNIYYRRENIGYNRLPLSKIPEATLRLIKSKNHLDLQLYAYAEQLFKEQITSFHELDLKKDLQLFRILNPLLGQANAFRESTMHKLLRVQTKFSSLSIPL
ncbi:MAG: sulfotransferase family 2 domain-containing protein [Cyanobacteria bacterium J06560_6]